MWTGGWCKTINCIFPHHFCISKHSNVELAWITTQRAQDAMNYLLRNYLHANYEIIYQQIYQSPFSLYLDKFKHMCVNLRRIATYSHVTNRGPVHMFSPSRYTTPAKCSRNKFLVQRSDCEHCELFSVPLCSDLKSAHISVCAVWLIVYTHFNVRNVWGHFNVHSPCW